MKVPVYPIGSFSQKDSVWWWAWANSSFPRNQRKKSKQFKDLYENTGIENFKQKAFEADLDLIWQLIAICFTTSDDLGVYHMEVTEDQLLFLFIEKT